MNRNRSLLEFDYQIEKDLGVNETPATWAEGKNPSHRFWGDEDHAITIPGNDDDESAGSAAAMSADSQLLAVARRHKVYIYHIPSRELRWQFSGLTHPCH